MKWEEELEQDDESRPGGYVLLPGARRGHVQTTAPFGEHHPRHGESRPTGARPQAMISAAGDAGSAARNRTRTNALGHHRLEGRNGSLGRTDVDEAPKERAARVPNAEPARSGQLCPVTASPNTLERRLDGATEHLRSSLEPCAVRQRDAKRQI